MRYFTLFFLSLLMLSCSAQNKKVAVEPTTQFVQSNFSELFASLSKRTNFDSLIADAQLFLDSAYVGKTLEVGNDTNVVINIREFDCLTLVENVIAFHKSKGDEDEFVKWIEKIRYATGTAEGYASRLHYFSYWILSNTSKNWIKDVTCDLGGDSIVFNVNFMSRHPQYYPQLAKNITWVDSISKMEEKINKSTFCYLPKESIQNVEAKIKNGDIIGICTNIEGLDFAHNGIALRKNHRLHMLHASSDYKRVMITEQPLSDYLADMKHMTGIVVLRLVE